MAKRIERVVLRSRYISVNQGGQEMYTEGISLSDDIRSHIPAAKMRLRDIRRAMPLGKWGMNIEEQFKDLEGNTHFKIVDVEVGKVKEQVL